MKRATLLSMEGLSKTREILDQREADLAIINSTMLNVYTGEWLENQAITINDEWIIYVGDNPGESIGPDTNVIDAGGKVVIPGLIDAHTHPADCFYQPEEFLKHSILNGTTTVIAEAIEPYCILKKKGVEDFLDAFIDQPINIFATVPPLVSTSESFPPISKKDLQNLLLRNDVIGLGESYWQGVLRKPDVFLERYKQTLDAGKRIEGHSAGARGRILMTYFATGVSSCHEPTTADEVLERLRLGIYVMVREGSIRRELEGISGIQDKNIDMGRLILVSDGITAFDLINIGYMDAIVQKAIDYGFSPATAIGMATLNPATYFGLDGVLGGISPGKYANILILPDTETIKAELVISRGRVVAKDNKLIVSPKPYTFSKESLNSIHLPREFNSSDFEIHAPRDVSQIKARVIHLITDLVTKEMIVTLPVKDHKIQLDGQDDIIKVAAIDRMNNPRKTFLGLLKGFGLKEGAFASSSGWDTSDIIVVGANDKDMAFAVNRIKALNGGAVLCANNKILSEIPMPILGLMSNLSMENIARAVSDLFTKIKELGTRLTDPYRTLVTLTGSAIPFIRICEEGLVDIKSGKMLSLFIE